jgi:phosphatidate cytidylyltransferase
MKSFTTRAISALIALAILIGLFYFLGNNGIKIAVIFASLKGTQELIRMLLRHEQSMFLKVFFYILTLAVFGATCLSLSLGALVMSITLVFFAIATLLTLHKTGDLQRMSLLPAHAVLGFIYMGFLPAFAYRIIDMQNGLAWFIMLLGVVFAGDTMAYVFGVLWGKQKLMPHVSPKKSLQGSIGGLFGSGIAGALCGIYLLQDTSLPLLIALSLVAGICAQFGDFFESLLKRYAGVKDSGTIMPGHGGVLDRIDGVLFATPIILSGALYLNHVL